MYSLWIAYLLWFLSFFGLLGFHRLYLGKIPSAILWMFTGGLFGIGTIYDFITLPGQVREANIRNALFNSHQEAQTWRHIPASDTRYAGESSKISLERTILKLANENKGILTVSEVALAANITIDESKKFLENLVSKGIADLRVRKTGTLVYVMPDIVDKDEPLEDF